MGTSISLFIFSKYFVLHWMIFCFNYTNIILLIYLDTLCKNFVWHICASFSKKVQAPVVQRGMWGGEVVEEVVAEGDPEKGAALVGGLLVEQEGAQGAGRTHSQEGRIWRWEIFNRDKKAWG